SPAWSRGGWERAPARERLEMRRIRGGRQGRRELGASAAPGDWGCFAVRRLRVRRAVLSEIAFYRLADAPRLSGACGNRIDSEAMNDELLALVQLQDTDQNIHRLHEEIRVLPRQLAALEEKLARQKAGVEAATAAIKDEEAKRR